MDHVGPNVAAQPLDEFFDLLALPALFAFEHRDAQRAELLGPHARTMVGRQPEQARAVQQAIQCPRRVAEEGRVLLQVDVDPAERHAVDADAGLVGP